MIALDEARRHILAVCAPLEPRAVALADALGCVTSVELTAEEAVPPFANTAMDGFAVRAADTVDAPVTLKVVGTLAAGGPADVEVGAGECLRIMTGAPMPPAADAVVMVERTHTDDGGATVVIEKAAVRGDHVRSAGDDLAPGQLVFEPFTVLGPAHIGVLASLGFVRVPVYPRPRVGVLSTGDELVEGAVVLRPGQIRDSNRPTLLGLVHESGFVPVDLGLVGDDEAAIRDAVDHGLAECDALVTSGGVSVGEFDYVKTVLESLGRMRSWQVAIKPAKPLAFGLIGGKPVFGLPGNPVSSMVSYELFARPALRQMGGHRNLHRPEVDAVADETLGRRADGKLHLVRVAATLGGDGRFHVRPTGGQGSHQLRSASLANALALVPDGHGVEEGGSVRTMLFGAV